MGVLCHGVQLGSRDWCLVSLLSQWGEKGCQWHINLQQKGHKGARGRKIDICYWLICCHICSQVCNTNEVAPQQVQLWKIGHKVTCFLSYKPSRKCADWVLCTLQILLNLCVKLVLYIFLPKMSRVSKYFNHFRYSRHIRKYFLCTNNHSPNCKDYKVAASQIIHLKDFLILMPLITFENWL